MKKVLGMLLLMASLLPFLAKAADQGMGGMQPSMGMVTDQMKQCTGTWTGKGTMLDPKTGQMVPYSEIATIRPVLENKFMLMESTSQPNQYGEVFSGKGLTTYIASQDKYIFNWFDSYGTSTKFVGTKSGNTILYVHDEANSGDRMILTIVMNNGDTEHHMTLQSQKLGQEPVQLVDITYIKTSSSINNYKNNY